MTITAGHTCLNCLFSCIEIPQVLLSFNKSVKNWLTVYVIIMYIIYDNSFF